MTSLNIFRRQAALCQGQRMRSSLRDLLWMDVAFMPYHTQIILISDAELVLHLQLKGWSYCGVGVGVASDWLTQSLWPQFGSRVSTATHPGPKTPLDSHAPSPTQLLQCLYWCDMQIASLLGLDLYIHCALETKVPPHGQPLLASGCTAAGMLHPCSGMTPVNPPCCRCWPVCVWGGLTPP